MGTFQNALDANEKPAGSVLSGSPRLSEIVSEMPAEDVPDVLRALRGGPQGPTAEHVAATLTGLGWPVSSSTIKLYRRTLARTETSDVRPNAQVAEDADAPGIAEDQAGDQFHEHAGGERR